MTGTYSWLALVVDVLAAYRITRFLTADTFAGKVRWRIIRWAYARRAVHDWPALPPDDALRIELGDDVEDVELGPSWDRIVDDHLHGADNVDDLPPMVAILVRCRWCMGAWVAVGVVLGRVHAPEVWHPVAWGCAAASAAVLLAGLERD